ncbi:Glucose-responsive transcription factor [Savitreella phatthalungensis]
MVGSQTLANGQHTLTHIPTSAIPGAGAGAVAGSKLRKATKACDRCRAKRLRCTIDIDVDPADPNRTCSNCGSSQSECTWTREQKKRGPQKGFQKARQDAAAAAASTNRSNSHGSYSNTRPKLDDELNSSISPSEMRDDDAIAADFVRGYGEHRPMPSHQNGQTSAYQPFAPYAVSAASGNRGSATSTSAPASNMPPLPSPSLLTPGNGFHHPHHHHQPFSGFTPGSRSSSIDRKISFGAATPPAPFEPDVNNPAWMSRASNNHTPTGGLTPASGSLPFNGSSLPRVPALSMVPPSQPERVPWSHEAFERWYFLNQPTFPILDQDIDALRERLDRGHPKLREGLMLAVYSVTHRNRTAQKRDMLDAEIAMAEFRVALRNAVHGSHADLIQEKLTCLQVCLLLAVEADQRGLEASHIVGIWIARSVAQAYDLGLHTDEFDHPRLLVLGRRLWYILIILDRWHSVSASCPPFITEYGVRVVAPDRDLLGPLTSYLYRMSGIVASVYAFLISGTAEITTARLGGIESVRARVDEDLDAFRRDVEVVWGQMNLLNIAFWHVSLLSCLATTANPHTLKELAMRLASTLPSSATPYTPLNHHFFSLTACVLAHLAQRDDMREEVLRGLAQLGEAVEKHRVLVTDDAQHWDEAILKGLHQVSTFAKRPSVSIDDGSLLLHIRRHGYIRSFCLEFSV